MKISPQRHRQNAPTDESRKGDQTLNLQMTPAEVGSVPKKPDEMAGNQQKMVLFCMAHEGFFRNFQSVIELLLARGKRVHVHFSKRHSTISMADYEGFEASSGLFYTTHDDNGARNPEPTAEKNRIIRDVIFYSRSEFRGAKNLLRRFAELQKDHVIRRTTVARFQRILRWSPSFLTEFADRRLAAWDKFHADVGKSQALLQQHRPDVVVVTPLVNFNSREVDIVIAARRLGIPSLLAVASWDNLTNKGRIKAIPDRVAVWNEPMLGEARGLHGVPNKRLRITGAPLFDEWFTRQPSRSRAEFCAAANLNPDQPIIAYFASSQSIAGESELPAILAWVRRIRGQDDKKLRQSNILIRLHPMAAKGWSKQVSQFVSKTDMAIWKTVSVWPKHPTHPTRTKSRNAFFDSIFHADLIVGLNTSAMVEARILKKPVLTFGDAAVGDGQAGNLHFKYLVDEMGVMRAADLDAHVAQLAETLKDPVASGEVGYERVVKFLRPAQMGEIPTELLANQILELAEVGQRQ